MDLPGIADRAVCARCGGQFPVGQPCYWCQTDRASILCAVDAMKRRGWKRTFTGRVIVRTLERYAASLVDA